MKRVTPTCLQQLAPQPATSQTLWTTATHIFVASAIQLFGPQQGSEQPNVRLLSLPLLKLLGQQQSQLHYFSLQLFKRLGQQQISMQP